MADDSSPPFAETEPTAAQAELRSRLDRYLSAGFQRLPAGPLSEALATWAEPLLRRLALGLVSDGYGPLGVVRSRTGVVEAELAGTITKLRSEKDRRSAGRVTDSLRLLLGTFGELCLQAGWLVHGPKGTWFASRELPSLLIGQALLQQPRLREELRSELGKHADWADAAQVVVSLGDPIAPWVELMLGEKVPLFLRERLVVTCGALGGLATGTPVTAALQRVFELAVAGLMWLAPAWYDNGQRVIGQYDGFREEPSPWYLEPRQFVDCILWLAQASQALGGELALPPMPGLWRKVAPPLGPLIDTLGLTLRLSEAEARTVVALCEPAEALARGLFDASFWKELFVFNGRFLALQVQALEKQLPWDMQWLQQYGVPALLRAGMLTALAIPGDHAPAGALLNYEPLLPFWYRAWTQLLASTKEDRLATVWADAAQRSIALPDGEARKLIYEDAPAQLRAAGLWPQAVAALRRGIKLGQLTGHSGREPESTTQIAREAVLLRLCEFTEAEWTELIAATDAQTILGWRTLLEAGAPPLVIAGMLLKGIPEGVHIDLMQAWWQGLYWLMNDGPIEVVAALAPLGELSYQDLTPLCTWFPDLWLDRLCALELPWPALLQRQLLQRLACYSMHLDVRRRCTDALFAARIKTETAHD